MWLPIPELPALGAVSMTGTALSAITVSSRSIRRSTSGRWIRPEAESLRRDQSGQPIPVGCLRIACPERLRWKRAPRARRGRGGVATGRHGEMIREPSRVNPIAIRLPNMSHLTYTPSE